MVRVWPYFQFQLLKRDKSTLQIELGSVCLNGHTTLTTRLRYALFRKDGNKFTLSIFNF